MSSGGGRRRNGHMESIFGCPLHLFCSQMHPRLVGGASIESDGSGGVAGGRPRSSCQHFGGKGGSVSHGCLQGLDHGRVRGSDER